MKPDKVIVFDIWGRYAHFKKIYVTTSALSYGVPFKTSVYGIVGAIIGLENTGNKYLENFNADDCKIAIQVINPIKIQRLNVNLSVEPGPIKGNRKPTMMEYVTDPCYRIYFWHQDQKLIYDLLHHLQNKTSVYTPVLGLAHCLANYKFLGHFNAKPFKKMELIHSVIPKSQLLNIDSTHWENNEIHIQEQDMYPLEMNTKREVTKRDSILFDINGKPVKAEINDGLKIASENGNTNIIMM
jgi:CRISPR-associated protein Cas5h